MSTQTLNNPLIRPFEAGDQSSVRTLILNGLGEHFGQIDETLNPDLDQITENYLNKGHCFFVAEIENTIIGTGALMIGPDNAFGQIVRMSVAPTVRRLGIGRRLVNVILGEATKHNLPRVIVETNKDWYNAIGLYQSCGFTQYSEDEISVYMELYPPYA